MLKPDNELKHVSVIGAAGKMGSGIALILLQMMASQENPFRLNLIDTNDSMLNSLKRYLRDQLTRFAERTINSLRERYADDPEMIDNEQMVKSFVESGLDQVRFGSALEDSIGSTLIFEAIVEDIEAKAHLFAALDKIGGKKAYYFTNTSSIPISVLATKSHLDNRLIGYHFYNPPAVQKLLEIIVPEKVDPSLVSLATALAKSLNKTVVFSNDVAGFIGNGYFIREIAFTLSKAQDLASSMPLVEAIYLLNRVTQDYLVRPMGTFQLLDYVGIDVCQHIVGIMKAYIPGLSFDETLIKRMAADRRVGGQNPDGSQKDGFFHYEKNVPAGIYKMENKTYCPLSDIKEKCEKKLGPLPKEHIPWKTLSKDSEPKRKEKLKLYFKNLAEDHSLGATLAKEFLDESQKIASGLVSDGVTRQMEDVNTVLENGFFHLYGPNSEGIFSRRIS